MDIKHIEKSFALAESLQSKITDEIKTMEGMTGQMTRHFYNNLLSVPSRYLEIGAWKGSSCCSALCNNKIHATIIEDFSGFGSPREEFFHNLDKFKGENSIAFIEKDCFKVDVDEIGKFNIYLYDGDHSEASQYKALDYFLKAMEDVFVFIVDDWNWHDVRKGTERAIKDNNLEVLWKREIRLTQNNEHTPQPEASETWWNGIAVFLLKK